MLTGTQFAFGVRQAKTRKVDVLTPGFADIAAYGVRTGFAMGGGVLGDLTEENRRRLLEMIAEGEALSKGLEALVANRDGRGAEQIQRPGGDFGRDQRVAIAVAADPGAEGDLGQ